MCPKPVSREWWSLADVQDHWDSLILRSWVTRDGETELYQEGLVTRMLAPLDLIARYTGGEGKLPVGAAMYCGTMPVLTKMGAAQHFEMELEDPVRGRRLRHGYDSRELPYND